MEAPTKYYHSPPPPTPPSKLKLLVYDTKQTIAFVYGFMTSFLICFLLILLSDPYGHFSSSPSSSSPTWYSKDSSQNASPALCETKNQTADQMGRGFPKEEPSVANSTTNVVSTNSDRVYDFFPSDLQNTTSDAFDESDGDELWDFPSVRTSSTREEEVPLSESSLAGIEEEMRNERLSESQLPDGATDQHMESNSTTIGGVDDGVGVGVMNGTSMGPMGGLRDDENTTTNSTQSFASIDATNGTVRSIDGVVGVGIMNGTSMGPIEGLRGDENTPTDSTQLPASIDATNSTVGGIDGVGVGVTNGTSMDQTGRLRGDENSAPNDSTQLSTSVDATNNTVGGIDGVGVGVMNGTSIGPIATSTSSMSTSNYMSRFGVDDEEYESMLGCDLYEGRWVKDEAYPLYPRGSCPYVDENFNCSNNGRPDSGYESYRWKPKQCTIPRLKGKDLLELIRGKRLVIVGDSLNRNMWESLVCILWNSVEDQSRVVRNYGKHKFKDYDCTVEFFWAPFLVQQSEISNADGSKSKRLRLDVLDSVSNKYKDADILVFNSGAWYTEFKTSFGRNYYQQGSHVYPMLDEFRAYRRGMITWGKWVDANVNQTKTRVLFRGNSATHFGGGKWNSGGRCDWQTKPIKKDKYLPNYPYKMKILESVIKYMRTPVQYLNITRLTAYRKDAHPAAYRRLYLTEKERMNPLRPQDCTHWCLPGVPDTWNEILNAQLLIDYYKKQKQKTTK